eukprot:7446937-Pyramimonas_sp.AAC.1
MVNAISYHATRAGAKGIDDLSHPPDSSHRAEHLRAAISNRSTDAFFSPLVPMRDKERDCRVRVPLQINLPFDQIAESWREAPSDFGPANFPE